MSGVDCAAIARVGLRHDVRRTPAVSPTPTPRKLMKIANAVEPVQDGRIFIEKSVIADT
jgi:hypothetical protein